MSRGEGARPYHRFFAKTSGGHARLPRRIVVGLLAVLGALTLLLALVRLGSSTLTLPEHLRRDYRDGGTWREMFDFGFTDATAALAWILALVVSGVVGLPYAW